MGHMSIEKKAEESQELMNDLSNKDLLVTAIRWTARIWSAVNIVLLSVLILGHSFGTDANRISTWRDFLEVIAMPGGVMTGMILGWISEGLGGTITVGSLLAFYLLLLTEGRFPGFVFVLAAAPGFLFLVAWLGSRSKATAETTS
jgi:hypothetical protein